MQNVGHFLQLKAIEDDSGDKDLYARSAYNRYYYAVFLCTREMFANFDTSWATLAHKAYPGILKGKLTQRFKRERLRALKTGDSELVAILEAASRAAAALANLMEKAYGIRVVADYEPGELVKFLANDRFSLKSINITEAHTWESQGSLWVRAIQKAWRQLDG